MLSGTAGVAAVAGVAGVTGVAAAGYGSGTVANQWLDLSTRKSR